METKTCFLLRLRKRDRFQGYIYKWLPTSKKVFVVSSRLRESFSVIDYQHLILHIV